MGFSRQEYWSGLPFSSPGGLPDPAVKNLPNAGDVGLIPGLGRSLREGNGYSLQYSCLGNLKDKTGWL